MKFKNLLFPQFAFWLDRDPDANLNRRIVSGNLVTNGVQVGSVVNVARLS